MQSKGYRAVAALGILAAAGLIVFGVWSMSRGAVGAIGFSGEAASETMSVTAAKSIDFEGFWDVKLTSGQPALRFSADKDQLEHIKFSQDGDRVTLRQEGMNFGRAIQVELSMPTLSDLRFQGAGSLELQGFELKELRLVIQGGNSVKMTDSAVENLELVSEGACNAELQDSSVTNAKVELRGASNASLRMNGGTLSGKIEGVGHLSYSGSVSSEDVRTDGLAKVEKE